MTKLNFFLMFTQREIYIFLVIISNGASFAAAKFLNYTMVHSRVYKKENKSYMVYKYNF